MDEDIICSYEIGIVGESFSIETTSQFDKAALTYAIDKSKLGDTEFDNLVFLRYNLAIINFILCVISIFLAGDALPTKNMLLIIPIILVFINIKYIFSITDIFLNVWL